MGESEEHREHHEVTTTAHISRHHSYIRYQQADTLLLLATACNRSLGSYHPKFPCNPAKKHIWNAAIGRLSCDCRHVRSQRACAVFRALKGKYTSAILAYTKYRPRTLEAKVRSFNNAYSYHVCKLINPCF